MIEKIMKAVKSSNKRRGRNITIGAVVGFLLSCTAVMGADDNYLWIKEDSEGIKFSTDSTTGDNGEWTPANPYSNNNWDTATKTYTNNTLLSSSAANGKDRYNENISHGLRLSGDLTNVNFTNNGSVIGTISSSSNAGYGIYNEASKMGNIENAGVINGTGSSGTGSGIYNSGTMGNIVNIGIISGSGTSSASANGSGIYNYNSAKIGDITNTGVISASANGSGPSPSKGYGISNYSSSTMKNIINTGVINGYGSATGSGIYNDAACEIENITNTGIISGSGTSSGYGISSEGSRAEIKVITNTGVIYGKNNAIKNDTDATIDTVDNYGILATDGDNVVYDKASSITKNNYGLYIEKDGKITLGQAISSPAQVVVGYDKDGEEITRSMTIRNATLIGTPGKETETESFLLAGEVEKFDNSILNEKN